MPEVWLKVAQAELTQLKSHVLANDAIGGHSLFDIAAAAAMKPGHLGCGSPLSPWRILGRVAACVVEAVVRKCRCLIALMFQS